MSQYLIFSRISLLRPSRVGLSFIFIIAVISTLFAQNAYCAQATVAWNPDANQVAGYKVYYGLASGNYSSPLDAGNNTTYTLPSLSASTYYVAVTAYDSAGDQSAYSPELVVDSLTASAGAGGSISPSGTFFQSQGSTQTFTITPSAGYKVASVLVDGVSAGAVSSFTFSNITASHTISATFAASSTSYTITASAGSNGSISPSGSVQLSSGSTRQFTVTPNSGYTASVGGTCGGTLSGNTYTTNPITANCTVTASFALNSYTVTPSAGSGGSLSPSTAQSVNYNGKTSFTVTPNTGYSISSVTGCGGTLTGSSYTTGPITSNCTVSANFASATTYTISTSVQGSGSISPSGTVNVASGSSPKFTITPVANYKISGVKVDGYSVGAVSSYTFSNVKANHSIAATFARSRYRYSASVKSAGSVSPTGTASAVSNTNAVSATSTVADAGPDQEVKSGSAVTLNGSNSTDPVGRIVSCKWTQTLGSTVKLSNPSAQMCTFTAPNTSSGEVLAFNLAVTDSRGITTNAACLVNVSATDKAPSANAGADQSVSPYTNVTLNGLGSSDPDGAIVSYQWVQISGPPVTINNANSAQASFVAPDAGSLGVTLVFSLQVTDVLELTSRDQCMVSVVNAGSPPVANAGPNQTVAALSSATLDGSGSYGPVNSNISYRWKQISGVPVTLSDPAANVTSFTVPNVTGAQSTDLLFMLTVTDVNSQLSSTAKCIVTVKPR